jgi:hypothetical protein
MFVSNPLFFSLVFQNPLPERDGTIFSPTGPYSLSLLSPSIPARAGHLFTFGNNPLGAQASCVHPGGKDTRAH